jgi:hypothetical protein
MIRSDMRNDVDDSVVKRFTGVLKDILELELKAGNKIVETYDAKDGTFPIPNAIMIFLEKPFKTPIQTELEKIEYRDVNDPHYWKAEYFDKENLLFLCGKFDWP